MRPSEYLVDKLRAEAEHYKDIADFLERENKELRSECKFGAALSGMFGIAIGIIIGTIIAWQS